MFLHYKGILVHLSPCGWSLVCPWHKQKQPNNFFIYFFFIVPLIRGPYFASAVVNSGKHILYAFFRSRKSRIIKLILKITDKAHANCFNFKLFTEVWRCSSLSGKHHWVINILKSPPYLIQEPFFSSLFHIIEMSNTQHVPLSFSNLNTKSFCNLNLPKQNSLVGSVNAEFFGSPSVRPAMLQRC